MTEIQPAGWAELLSRLEQRNGVIELAPLGSTAASEPQVVLRAVASYELRRTPVWRPRLLRAEPRGLIVERPWSVRQMVPMPMDEPLTGLVIEGNERWAFRTVATEPLLYALNTEKNIPAIRLAPPVELHSAQRRDYFRVDTAASELPELCAWVMLDDSGAAAAMRANRLEHQQGAAADEAPAPTRGAKLRGSILDLSGGGVRVSLPLELRELLETWPPIWVEVRLPPLEVPLRTTARVVHWHVDAASQIVAGLSFHGEEDPAHAGFVTESLCRVSAHLQRLQLQRKK